MDEVGIARPLAVAAPLGVEDVRECWICLDAGGEDLIAPCKCSGSTRWVHRACLDTWRTRAPNPRMYMNCRHCDFRYLLDRRVVRTGAGASDEEQGPEAMAKRRRRLLGQAIRHFAVGAALVQVLILLLAIVIGVVDTQERLVALFNLRRLEPHCMARSHRGGGFFRTLVCHRLTYYLAAVLGVLAATGVVGALRFCCRAYRRHRHGNRATCLCSSFWWFAIDLLLPNRIGARTALLIIFRSSRAVLVAGAVSLAALVVAGMSVVIVGIVMWAQHVVLCYQQAAELGALTEEYTVRDLSAQPNTLGREGPPPQSLQLGEREPLDDVQGRLLGELNAVYGLEGDEGVAEQRLASQRAAREVGPAVAPPLAP